jgi:hypothetical protein
MKMTDSESQWLTRVMRTISYVAFMEPCNSMAGIVEKGAGEAVVGTARSSIHDLKQADCDSGDK